ncbi:ADP-ribosylglycohydrolase family protein [Arthrobacter yangruifuii]|uniref:ADP-ribosylglycohydrolase family protein n=1 Tax=Arthrobacter yangruifuii TaxID=2606616 RepID=A0A5N6MRT8_9MICC|nr:ADP-ribosylglycohydrolase family protein [Arthrobacter yangruifuii]KAD4059899.1 ADP-ribosylglycohydrolase family protein [Arthrobacter yangruifuii]
MNLLRDRVAGVLAGAAVGDALGGATEGWSPEQIEERHGGWVEGIVGPFLADWKTARPIAPYHKGDGHITDDTLMTHALVEVYARRRRHLDAYDVAADLVPLMIGERRWVPELEDSALILQRVFLAEKWIVAKLHYGHADPREAGVGNIVNCGATMYMAPVGLVHIGDPRGAYAEAIDLAGAHQSSYGREAAGVFAAAVAASAAPGATVADIRNAVLDVAHDGTAAAIRAVFGAVDAFLNDGGSEDPRDVARTVRAAVAPFDTVGENYRSPAMDARLPSRTKSIEELPAALGFVVARGGNLRASVLDAVNYGRDADSIAAMAGAVCGGLGGVDAVPPDWVAEVMAASRLDLDAVVDSMAEVVREVAGADADRAARRAEELSALLSREAAPCD